MKRILTSPKELGRLHEQYSSSSSSPIASSESSFFGDDLRLAAGRVTDCRLAGGEGAFVIETLERGAGSTGGGITGAGVTTAESFLLPVLKSSAK